VSISVLIMTLNEEENLKRCLDSVSWSDDVVVLDSYSADATVEIARAAGARVVQRAFDDELRQRRFGIHEIAFKHRWLYMPDADEVTPPELRDEMLAIARDEGETRVAFRARYKNMFMGRWIRRSSLYPTWIMRLIRPDRVRLEERTINIGWETEGAEGRLKNHFLHFSFNKGLEHWFEKHNRYSAWEARETLRSLARGGFDWRSLLSTNPVDRRRALKELSFRVPCRPMLRFLYMYLWRGGFLDGRPGLLYCRMIAAYELMIVAKMDEMRRREEGLPI
jgi:glycosyltransferase involved in cell wall biosynthesis